MEQCVYGGPSVPYASNLIGPRSWYLESSRSQVEKCTSFCSLCDGCYFCRHWVGHVTILCASSSSWMSCQCHNDWVLVCVLCSACLLCSCPGVRVVQCLSVGLMSWCVCCAVLVCCAHVLVCVLCSACLLGSCPGVCVVQCLSVAVVQHCLCRQCCVTNCLYDPLFGLC